MKVLNWKREDLHFRNAVLTAWVARSARVALLEREWKNLGPRLPKNTSLILRWPPWPSGAPEPDIELWKIRGLGSFDSIRFAKFVFNSPADKLFCERVDSLEAIIGILSEGFVEGEFKLVWLDDYSLIFHLTKPFTKVTSKQYAVLDKINGRFFGADMKTADASAPGSFQIGPLD